MILVVNKCSSFVQMFDMTCLFKIPEKLISFCNVMFLLGLFQKWAVNGDTRIGLFAMEKIAVGTELTFNYQVSQSDKLNSIFNELTLNGISVKLCILGNPP